MKKFKLLLVAAIVAVGGFAATSVLTNAPEKAQAAPKCKVTAYHPTDNSWSCASGTAGWYHACDYHVDGHRVRAHIDTIEPGPRPDRLSGWAPSQGCSGWRASRTAASTSCGSGPAPKRRAAAPGRR